MSTHLAYVALLPAILKAKGVEHIVISPGSRNAPLIQVFTREFPKNCVSIVDERSAGYYALGIAMHTKQPVVIICTSGTAALNYAPAIAEAFFQGVPLIALTADRPPEWIDMQDNQAIRQQGIFANNCKKELQLPVSVVTPEDKWYVERIVNEAYTKSISDKPGPVHINIPLREPLYQEIAKVQNPRIITCETICEGSLSERLVAQWSKATKKLMVIGQMPYSKELIGAVNLIAENNSVVCLAESISNIKGRRIISQIDCVKLIGHTDLNNLKPDLIIYVGGSVVSKSLKAYLRKFSDIEQWYVSPTEAQVDTFEHLTTLIKTPYKSFFRSLLKANAVKTISNYFSLWKEKEMQLNTAINMALKDVEFSDLKAFELLQQLITPQSIVFAGNSSVIRYLQLFKPYGDIVYSNRGTSGIDGCVSTAVGVASVSTKPVYAIVGDISFVYDSNGLWNRDLPDNLKIIVINNQGGNIFGLIEGPAKMEAYNDFFVASHPVNLKKLTEAFQVQHFSVNSIDEFLEQFKQHSSYSGCSVLELTTRGEINAEIFRNFNKKITQ